MPNVDNGAGFNQLLICVAVALLADSHAIELIGRTLRKQHLRLAGHLLTSCRS